MRHSSGDNLPPSNQLSSVTDKTDSENSTDDIIPDAPEVPVEAAVEQVEKVFVSHSIETYCLF